MADDSSNENQNPPVAKEKEMWGVPMSTWYSAGIIAVGAVSLITALKVLLPPNFQLFPPQAQQNQGQGQGLPLFGMNLPSTQQQPQYQYPNQGNGNSSASNNNPVPRQDNSVEEYEVYDESAYRRGLGPKNIDVGVGQQQQAVYEEEEEDGNSNSKNQIQTDNTQFRTTESVMRNNSGIQITESPDVVNSKKRFVKGAYAQGSEYTDLANLDYE